MVFPYLWWFTITYLLCLKNSEALIIIPSLTLYLVELPSNVWHGCSVYALLFTLLLADMESVPLFPKPPYTERRSFISIKNNYFLAFKQIFKLLKKFWLVFIIFIPIGVFFFHKSLFNTKIFLLSLFGLSNAYNAEWWYIKQYIMMVLLFPIFDFFLCNIVYFINNYIIKKFKYGKMENSFFLLHYFLADSYFYISATQIFFPI